MRGDERRGVGKDCWKFGICYCDGSKSPQGPNESRGEEE